MVLRHGGGGVAGGGFLAGNQVVPLNYEAEVSQRLLQASISNDLKSALECLSDPVVDVNYVGATWLKIRKTGVVLRQESPNEICVDYEELRADVTPLFVAATNGNKSLVRNLLNAGAEVNLRLFWGFPCAAASREGHYEILEILLKAGASQPACEEALIEASSHGYPQLVELLMNSDLIRPHAAVHSLVTACCRGFTEVVDTLIKCGVDANATDRILLQSSKPTLHANADSNALVAAIVSRQITVVRRLLMAGVRTDVEVKLGAWSWDVDTGEEFRVGAGLGEPYPIVWCAVEYFESTGTILRTLLQHLSPETPHRGRTLLHHAILCDNDEAVKVLVKSGADFEKAVKTTLNVKFCPIHMAVRLGLTAIVQTLIDSGCDLNSVTDSGETALMVAAKEGRVDAFRLLVCAGADVELRNESGETAITLIEKSRNRDLFEKVMMEFGIEKGNGDVETEDVKSENEDLILSAVARELVLGGCRVRKHTRGGKGAPHVKVLRMEGGVLRWGKSRRRNVICEEVEVGSSLRFRRRRGRKGDGEEAGIFRVKTSGNKEFHFVCEGGVEMAELWVRGIRDLTREAKAVGS